MADFLLQGITQKSSYVTINELKNCANASLVPKKDNVMILYSEIYASMQKKITTSFSNKHVVDILAKSTFDLLSLNKQAVVVLSPSSNSPTLFGRATITLGEPHAGGTIIAYIPEDCSLTYLVIISVESGNLYNIPARDIKSINAELLISNSINGYKIVRFTASDYDGKSGFEGLRKCVSFVLKKKAQSL
jgi:hypothetical protein